MVRLLDIWVLYWLGLNLAAYNQKERKKRKEKQKDKTTKTNNTVEQDRGLFGSVGKKSGRL